MSQKLKNIFYLPNPSNGGIERNLDLWAKNCSKFDENENYILTNKYTVSHKLKSLKACFISLHYIISEKSDNQYKYNFIVFRNILKPLIWITLLRVLGYRNINLVYRANNDPLHWLHERSIKRAISELMKLLILPLYDLVIYNSYELKNRCHYYNSNYVVLPNPVKYEDQITYKSKNLEILYIGRDAKQKNIKNLITAMGKVDKDINLTIIGFENTKYHASNNINFISWSSLVDYSKYSYLILPSLYEGSPNALLEGLNNGLIPILTPFKSGGSELVEAFKCCYFIAKDFSIDGLAETITKAVNTKINFKTSTPEDFRLENFEKKLQVILKYA